MFFKRVMFSNLIQSGKQFKRLLRTYYAGLKLVQKRRYLAASRFYNYTASSQIFPHFPSRLKVSDHLFNTMFPGSFRPNNFLIKFTFEMTSCISFLPSFSIVPHELNLQELDAGQVPNFSEPVSPPVKWVTTDLFHILYNEWIIKLLTCFTFVNIH